MKNLSATCRTPVNVCSDHRNAERITDLSFLPAPPEGAAFQLLYAEKVPVPHEYAFGPGHYAASTDMDLDVELCEKLGACCETCKELHRKRGTKILSYAEHENIMTLFIEVPQNKHLNRIPSLYAYLSSIREGQSPHLWAVLIASSFFGNAPSGLPSRANDVTF